MAEARSLPIPAEHRELTVKVDGTAIERSHQLLAAYVTKSANKISSARLVYLDGAASSSDFPLSNSDSFVPGKELEILAGSGSSPVALFKGVVIRQSIKVRDYAAPQLIVECRHKAVKLTVGRKNGYFLDQTDSDVIISLFDRAGVPAEVESTKLRHKEHVQYYCTDWDFVLMRAAANGKLVFTNGDKVEIKSPVFQGAPVCSLHFGSTVIEMDAEIDARLQYSAVKSFSWDSAQQSVTEKEAADPNISGPGNLAGDDLASAIALDHWRLQHSAATEEEAQAWTDSEWLKSKMSKVSGRIKCEGIGTVNPGDIVALAGIGERYNGNGFVTGVYHAFDTAQNWKTHIQFGGVERWPTQDHVLSAPKAAALVPGVNGLQIGIVTSN